MDAFAYSEEEGKRIITTASLLDEENTASKVPDNSDLRSLSYELKRLKEKDIKLDLNSITLSDYWRKGFIPRGLRIKKFPAYGSGVNGEFKKKWEAILSKCSFDLILLLIEEAKKDREFIQQEIEEINKKLEEFRSDQWTDLHAKLTENLKKFKDQLVQDKLRKFQRDEKDYKENRVYSWLGTKSFYQEPYRRGARTVSFNFTSEEEDQDTSNGGRGDTSGNDQLPLRKRGTNKQQNKGQINQGREEDVRKPPYYRTRHHQRTRL